MFGFTIAEVFLVGGFVLTVIYSYFKVNQLPIEWSRWKEITENRLERVENAQRNLEHEIQSLALPIASVQATLKSVEDRIQRVDNHLGIIIKHLITKGKDE